MDVNAQRALGPGHIDAPGHQQRHAVEFPQRQRHAASGERLANPGCIALHVFKIRGPVRQPKEIGIPGRDLGFMRLAILPHRRHRVVRIGLDA